MELENFKKEMQILEDRKAEAYRKLYINKYINTDSKYYIERIENLRLFSDGLCYIGYLWESLKSPIFIHEEQIEQYRSKLKQVLIFWDNSSKDRIYIKDYWKFGKKTMVRVDY
ncbi:hypothetical protein, partial [Selenomonas artemidis]|uniref:hypothetical protein n=1 Tax=Selenomonas artemidis TaxID=671224 RepID=UPI00288AE61D